MIFKKQFESLARTLGEGFAIVINEVKDENKILQSEIGALHAKFDDRNELFEKIVKLEEEICALERDNALLEEIVAEAHEEYGHVRKENAELTEALDEALNKEIRFNEILQGKKSRITELEGMLETSERSQTEQRNKMSQLEKAVSTLKCDYESATEVHTASLERHEAFVQLVKDYDKATVTMLNAFIARESVMEPREIWEKAKEALKIWGTPEVKTPAKRTRKRKT